MPLFIAVEEKIKFHTMFNKNLGHIKTFAAHLFFAVTPNKSVMIYQFGKVVP